jgi:hypothetical protein
MDGGHSSTSSLHPPPPDATDMPPSPHGGAGVRGVQMSGPQPVNPDDLGVDKQFLPSQSHGGAPSVSDGAPSGFGTSGGGGIASYQTQPLL